VQCTPSHRSAQPGSEFRAEWGALSPVAEPPDRCVTVAGDSARPGAAPEIGGCVSRGIFPGSMVLIKPRPPLRSWSDFIFVIVCSFL
jgi:hypothetical protein